MSRRRAFGELELAALAYLRDHPESSVKEVHGSLGGAYTTIMTVLNRLASKGEVERAKEGRCFLYCVGHSKKGILNRLREQVFGGRALPMVRALVDEEVSDEELAEIEQMIAKAREERR